MFFMKCAFQTKEHNAMRTKLISKLFEMCPSNFMNEFFSEIIFWKFRKTNCKRSPIESTKSIFQVCTQNKIFLFIPGIYSVIWLKCCILRRLLTFSVWVADSPPSWNFSFKNLDLTLSHLFLPQELHWLFCYFLKKLNEKDNKNWCPISE